MSTLPRAPLEVHLFVALSVILAAATISTEALAQSSRGQLDCAVTENQARSAGTMVVSQGGKRIASGTCGRPVKVKPGKYEVSIQLDSALDRPSKQTSVTVASGATAVAKADFSTAMLQVNVKARGARGAIMIAVLRGSSRIGTLRNGAQKTLSAGKYTISVKQSDKNKTEAIELRPGQRRAVRIEL